MFQHSRHNQGVQMADLVAWSGYQGLARLPKREFAWERYDRYLRARDVNGGPVAV